MRTFERLLFGLLVAFLISIDAANGACTVGMTYCPSKPNDDILALIESRLANAQADENLCVNQVKALLVECRYNTNASSTYTDPVTEIVTQTIHIYPHDAIQGPDKIRPQIRYLVPIYVATLSEPVEYILTPLSSGGSITNCTSSPALPLGLSLDKSTCRITGVPTVAQDAKTYQITASNSSGISPAASLQISVQSCSLSISSASLFSNNDIYANVTSKGMSRISYSCNGGSDIDILNSYGKPVVNTGSTPINVGKLPAGNYSCTVKGLPTGSSGQKVNCIAPNPLNFLVQNPSQSLGVPRIYFAKSSYSVNLNEPISAITPKNYGGAITYCSSSPALPAGLSLDPNSCSIEGTPTVAQSPQSYTIISKNRDGYGQRVVVNIGVHYCSFRLATTALDTSKDVTVKIASTGMKSMTFACNENPESPILDSYGKPLLNTGTGSLNIGKLPKGFYSCLIKGEPVDPDADKATCAAPMPLNFEVKYVATGTLQPEAPDLKLGSPIISYAKSTFIFSRGVAISPVSPTNSGGVITNCVASPTLPVGLILNSTTCAISGTPSVAQSPADYQITASSASGSALPVKIQIGVHYCSIALGITSITTATDALLTASSLGMSKLTFSCNGNPEADFLNSSGTPVLNTGSTPYNIGKLDAGSYSCTFLGVAAWDGGKKVNCSAPNPIAFEVSEAVPVENGLVPNISYSKSDYGFSRNSTISTLNPTNSGGAATNCISSPTLPAGLKLNTVNCSISGTPTSAQALTTYKIIASNSAGIAPAVSIRIGIYYCSIALVSTNLSTSTDVLLNVSSLGMSKLTYSCNGNSEADFLNSTGSPVLNSGSSPYNVGKLPAEAYVCTFRGIATWDGNQKVNCAAPNPISFTVKDVPPAIAYSKSSVSFSRYAAILPMVPTNTGGAITNCVSTPTLPAGLQLNSANCTISGTPSVAQQPTDYQIVASNSSGSSTVTLRLGVHFCAVSLTSSNLTTTTDVFLNASSLGMSKLTYSCNSNPESDFLNGSGTPVLNTGSSPYNVGKLPADSYSCTFRGIASWDSNQKVNCVAPNPINFDVRQ